MKRIETITDLRQAWQSIMGTLKRDLGAAGRLAMDPVGTLRELGYDLGEDARGALLMVTAAA
jgi:hypothetical protein